VSTGNISEDAQREGNLNKYIIKTIIYKEDYQKKLKNIIN